MFTPISPYRQSLRRRHASSASDRRGAATVEMAIVLPLFLIMIFGSLEVCHRLFTRQSVVIAAYESARVASRQTSDTAAVTTRCQELLSQSGIKGATVQVRDISNKRDNLDAIATGDEFRIRITVPWGRNTISRFVVSEQGEFQIDAHMLRE